MKYHYLKKPRTMHDWRAIALISMLLAAAFLIMMLDMSNRVEPRDLVYQVCNESRMSATIKEDGCGALQDQLHMEFLCTSANDRPDNHCWVEQK